MGFQSLLPLPITSLAGLLAMDGVTDDSIMLNALITAATINGGQLVVPAGRTMTIAHTVTLQNNVVLRLLPGSIVRWTGVAGGTMFTTSTVNPTQGTGVIGDSSFIDPGTGAGTVVFRLHSPQYSQFGGFQVATASTTTTLFQIRADAANMSGIEGERHALFNNFSDIICPGTIGTVFDAQGQASPSGGVTINRFANIEASFVNVCGIKWGPYADTGIFEGFHRYNLEANNAIGLDVAADINSNDIVFHSLAIDTFGVFTGRIAVRLGSGCYQIYIYHLEYGPDVSGGTVVDNGASSYWIAANAGLPLTVKIFTRDVVFYPADALTIASDTAALTPNLQVENFANSGNAEVTTVGRDVGGNIVEGLLASTASAVLLGANSSHTVQMLFGGVPVWALTSILTSYAEGHNFAFGTATGTMLGTAGGAAGQKIGFWGKTPVTQPLLATGAGHTVDDVITALQSIGLLRQT